MFQAGGNEMPRGRPKGTKTAKRAVSKTEMSLKAIMKNLIRMSRKGEIGDVEIIIRPLK
jgi:hypothetical protein